MIKEPENYEIYKLIFEIINPNQIRAISTDTRMVFLRDHLLADPSTLNLIKPTLMGHKLLAFNPGNPIWRVPHLSYNYHYVNLNRDYVNQPIGLQLHVLRNSLPDSKYPSYVTELLFIKSLQGKEFYPAWIQQNIEFRMARNAACIEIKLLLAADSTQMSLAEACGIQIGDRIVEGKT